MKRTWNFPGTAIVTNNLNAELKGPIQLIQYILYASNTGIEICNSRVKTSEAVQEFKKSKTQDKAN